MLDAFLAALALRRLEILLIMWAWRCGWGAWALLPTVVVLTGAMVLEFAGVNVFNNDSLLWNAYIIECGALITMIIIPFALASVSKNAPENAPENAPAQPDLESQA